MLIPSISGKRHSYTQIMEGVQMCHMLYRNTLWVEILLNVMLTMFIVIVSTTILFYLFQLYEINDDPKRKEFLDDLFSFMQKRGKSSQSVFHRQYVYFQRLCYVLSVDYGERTFKTKRNTSPHSEY